jgi:hypothetical protein
MLLFAPFIVRRESEILDVKNLIGTGICTKLQTTQPPPEFPSQNWTTNRGMEEISFWLTYSVLRTVPPYQGLCLFWSCVRSTEYVNQNEISSCVTPLFGPFPWVEPFGSKVRISLWEGGFPGSTIHFRGLRILIFDFWFLISYFILRNNKLSLFYRSINGFIPQALGFSLSAVADTI